MTAWRNSEGFLVLGGMCAAVVLAATPARADWTLGAFAGASHTRAAALEITQPSLGTAVRLEPVRLDSGSFDPPIYYGYRGGVFPASWNGFGIEGEFIHLKVIAQTSRPVSVTGTRDGQPISASQPMHHIVERFSITHGVNLITINGAYRRALGAVDRSRVHVIVRAGAGFTVPHAESTIGGISQEGYEIGARAYQAAAGADVRLAGRLYAIGDYKWSRTVQTVDVDRGTARIPLNTGHVTFGVALRFGR
jgi:hypothetical protein